MIELLDTLSSYINKITEFFGTLWSSVTQSIEELKTWFDLLPVGLVAAAGVIIVLLIIFRVLGR